MEKDSLYMWCSHWDPGKTVGSLCKHLCIKERRKNSKGKKY